MMVNTLLFDLDGTLIDTNRLIVDTFKMVFKDKFPTLTISEEEIFSFIGPTLNSTFSKFVDTEEEINELVNYYRQINLSMHDQYVTIYDNVYDTLKYLSENNYNLGVVTSKKKSVAYKGLKLFGIDKFFKVVIGPDDVLKHKPHPEGIYKALESFDNVSKVLYVGDNENDIFAAKNANVISVGVSWSYNLKALIKSNPDYMINDFKELIEIVK